MRLKKHRELGNRTIEEAKEDLRQLNDPTSLSYNDNWVHKALCDKYGMNPSKLANVIMALS
jgi:hypothetical protein